MSPAVVGASSVAAVVGAAGLLGAVVFVRRRSRQRRGVELNAAAAPRTRAQTSYAAWWHHAFGGLGGTSGTTNPTFGGGGGGGGRGASSSDGNVVHAALPAGFTERVDRRTGAFQVTPPAASSRTPGIMGAVGTANPVLLREASASLGGRVGAGHAGHPADDVGEVL